MNVPAPNAHHSDALAEMTITEMRCPETTYLCSAYTGGQVHDGCSGCPRGS
jgi:hypothetical protein